MNGITWLVWWWLCGHVAYWSARTWDVRLPAEIYVGLVCFGPGGVLLALADFREWLRTVSP